MQRLSEVATKDAHTILENIKEISVKFAQERSERQRRRELAVEDFNKLKDAGFLLTAVSTDQGGIWVDVPRSIRHVCEILRTLAQGDASVALVASMHPTVINAGGWLNVTEAPQPYTEAWEEQRRWVFQTACDGNWWATIVSEPGSGGDTSKTKAIARHDPSNGQYLITGQKHFGSGSGIASFMITTAVPEGESQPDTFFMDMRGVPWDGSRGVELIAPWEGHGMTSTQSHAMSFSNFPANRVAFPSHAGRAKARAEAWPTGSLFTAVVVGIVEAAIGAARQQLERQRRSLRAFEQVEWSRIEMEGWLIQQAYEGMLRSAESGVAYVGRNSLIAKGAVAELAESVTSRICRVIGGGTFSRHSPFGFWFEDVRALGFLRPPWGLAYDSVFDTSWESKDLAFV